MSKQNVSCIGIRDSQHQLTWIFPCAGDGSTLQQNRYKLIIDFIGTRFTIYIGSTDENISLGKATFDTDDNGNYVPIFGTPNMYITCTGTCQFIECNNPPCDFSNDCGPSNVCVGKMVSFYIISEGYKYSYTVQYNSTTVTSESASLTVTKSNIFSAIPPAVQNDNQPKSLPLVYISAETDGNDTEVMYATMIITDVYKYYLCRYLLCKEYTGVPTTSEITIYHPDLYPIIKKCCEHGSDVACNLIEKINDLIVCRGLRATNRENITTDRIISYGLVVYFFSALLYGYFDIDLVRKIYFCNFLKDLESSRFSKFAKIFTDPIYGFMKMQQFYIC